MTVLIDKDTKFHSVALHLVLVLLLGLLVPITAGMIITLEHEQLKLEDELSEFHSETLKTLVESTEDAMLSFSPEGVRNIVGTLLKDKRIVSIEVFSEIFDLYLLRVSKETPDSQFDSFSMRETVVKDGEVLGYVLVEVDNGWIIPRVDEARNHIILLFSSMFFGALLLVVPAIYFKILKPLRRLAQQADILSKGELGVACVWQGQDELSMLGKTLDGMRSKLNENFNVMKEMAVTDELTGLPNRHGFAEDIKKNMDLSRRYKRPLSIAIFDLDYFKAINDTYGHGVGDDVLKEFARLVCSRIRNTDLFARIGGEEFVMVMPETPIEAATTLVNEIREVVSSQPFAHGEKVTTSIGLTSYTGVEELDELLEAADKGLYQAKRNGRDQVVVQS